MIKILITVIGIILLALGIIYAGSICIERIIQQNIPSEITVGQIQRMQKSKIPGFQQFLFSYTKRGKPYEVLSRPIWYKRKFKRKGKYKIQVFYWKTGKKGTLIWADPISKHRFGK